VLAEVLVVFLEAEAKYFCGNDSCFKKQRPCGQGVCWGRETYCVATTPL